MIPAKTLWSGNLSANQITVEIVQESNRAIDHELEAKLLDRWQHKLAEAKQSGKLLYDGISYRLESFASDENGLKLTVSPYRFSIRSTLKKSAELEELGESYYSHGLSVGGFLVTSDDWHVLGHKSSKLASDFKRDTIGGVLEKIEPLSGQGIFNMYLTELNEELNLDPEVVESIVLLGLVRSTTTDVQLVTFARLKITRNELQAIFDKRKDMELDAIESVAEEDLEQTLLQMGSYKPEMYKLLSTVH